MATVRVGLGYIGNPHLINGTKATTKGYDKYRFQYENNGTISSTSSKNFSSKDLVFKKGMSGGPCYIYGSSEYGYMAIGIISRSISYDSSGYYVSDYVFRKIDEKLYNDLLRYCEEYAL